MKFSKQQVRQLRRDNDAWPKTLTSIPREKWPPCHGISGVIRQEAFRSREFLVQVFEEKGHLRLSVNRTDWDLNTQRWRQDISWDDLQRLKAEAGFPDAWAVEVFPADGHVINVANMRHIWLLNEVPTFAWVSAHQAELSHSRGSVGG